MSTKKMASFRGIERIYELREYRILRRNLAPVDKNKQCICMKKQNYRQRQRKRGKLEKDRQERGDVGVNLF